MCVHLVQEERDPRQRHAAAAPAAAGVVGGEAAEVVALEELDDVVPRGRGGRHDQHPDTYSILDV